MTTKKALRADEGPELAAATRLVLLAWRGLVAGQHEGLDPGAMVTLYGGGGLLMVEHGDS